MENNIQIFNNPNFGEIRVDEVNNEPVFCLADVCKALDIKNVSDCKSRLNKKGVVITDTLTNGGVQQMTFVNESNLYKCIFQSRRPFD
jgi:anti-repressor protein